jgi:hypothetical protein
MVVVARLIRHCLDSHCDRQPCGRDPDVEFKVRAEERLAWSGDVATWGLDGSGRRGRRKPFVEVKQTKVRRKGGRKPLGRRHRHFLLRTVEIYGRYLYVAFLP